MVAEAAGERGQGEKDVGNGAKIGAMRVVSAVGVLARKNSEEGVENEWGGARGDVKAEDELTEGDGGENGVFDMVADVPKVPGVVSQDVMLGCSCDLFKGLDDGVVQGEVGEDGFLGACVFGLGFEVLMEIGDEGEDF